jgi:hypothetical protein
LATEGETPNVIPFPGLRVTGGGGGPTETGLEARVALLEQMVRDIREGVTGIRSDLQGLREDVNKVHVDAAMIEGKVDALTGSD